MKVEKNKVVVICYEVEAEGNIVDKMTEEKPLDYIHGTNMLLPKIEEELEGKEEGYEFSFNVAPSEGYGEYDENKITDVPKAAFMVNGKIYEEILKVGTLVPMFKGGGDVIYGKIVEIKDEVVAMDFNHPMAGKTLTFNGKIISVREATEKELTEGLHGEFLPHECSCGGGCHCHDGSEGCNCDGGSCNCQDGSEGCGCGHHE